MIAGEAGTGNRLIERFSEDIDIRFDPPPELEVKSGKNQDKPAHQESRRRFFDWLAEKIVIPGLIAVERDTAFDEGKFRGGGIRLSYPLKTGNLPSAVTLLRNTHLASPADIVFISNP